MVPGSRYQIARFTHGDKSKERYDQPDPLFVPGSQPGQPEFLLENQEDASSLKLSRW
jgi:hypothetical protein